MGVGRVDLVPSCFPVLFKYYSTAAPTNSQSVIRSLISDISAIMVTSWLSVTAILIASIIQQTVSLKMRVTPEYAILRSGEAVDITCQGDAPLAACGFWIGWYPYMDLSSDNAAHQVANRCARLRKQQEPEFNVSALEYGGIALKNGRCSIRFEAGVDDMSFQNIGCRGRTTTGQWKNDYLTVFTKNEGTILPMEITPRHPPYVMLGDSYTVKCKADRPLEWCKITVGHTSNSKGYFINRRKCTFTGSELVEVVGEGLEKGECGIKVFNATEKDNGWVTCQAGAGGDTIALRFTNIPIATSPNRGPDMTVERGTLNVGDLLTAECSSHESRPPANITWYFDGIEVEGVEVPYDEPLWADRMQGRKQKLIREVTKADDGKELRCELSHVADPRKYVTTYRIKVNDAPVNSEASSVEIEAFY